jgi:Sulfotransferase domain
MFGQIGSSSQRFNFLQKVVSRRIARRKTALGDQFFNASGCLAQAEDAYRSALSTSPTEFAAFRGIGECLARQQRLEEAQCAHEAWFRRWIHSAGSRQLLRQQNKACRRGMPAMLLVSMQKSASEYLRENLMRALDIPELHIGIGTVPRDKVIPSAVQQLARGGAIARSHMDGANFGALAANGITRMLLQIRDPRQVTVSWTHMMRRLSDVAFQYAAKMYHPEVPADFRVWTLQQEIDWAIDNYLPGQLSWLESWAAVLDTEPSIPICVLKFEDFRAEEDTFFRRIANFYGLAQIDRPALSDQSAAAMRNFRLGDIDEWRTVLAPERLKVFNSRLKSLAERFAWNA